MRHESVAPEEESHDQVLSRLAALPPLEYDKCREREADHLGVRVGTLDAEVRRVRGVSDPTNEVGHSVTIDDPDPWSDPVDGAVLLDELAETVRRHVVLPAGAADAVALWVLHAHAHDTANISPILAATSPTPECGKSTLLTLLNALVPRPLPASNITAAALFRAVEKWRPTLLIDEADTFLRESDELRGVLNSGHNRGSAWVIRTAGDDHEPKQFLTWAPKAIALIGRLPATLASRALHIELRRMTANESVVALRADRLDHLDPLRRRAWRWAKDHTAALRCSDPDMPTTLRGRAADNWRHLLTIADVAGGEWPQQARTAAEALGAPRNEQTAGVLLLEDIREIFGARNRQGITSQELADALAEREDRPWPEWGRSGKPITPRQLARLLEPFGIRPRRMRLDGHAPGTRGYQCDAFEDAFSRYLPDQSATAPQRLSHGRSDDFPSATNATGVANGEARDALPDKACGVVADRNTSRREVL